MSEPTWPSGPPGGWRHHRHGRLRHEHWRQDRANWLGAHAHWWRGTCDGQPLRRDAGDRLIGGCAAGLARWRGLNPTTVRIVFVIVALFSQGWFVPFYCIGWLVVPGSARTPGIPGLPDGAGQAEGASAATAGGTTDALPAEASDGGSIWSRARHDSPGITLALAIGSLLAVVILVGGLLNDQLVETYGWPQVVTGACLVLIWRNATGSEQAALRRLVAPLGGLGSDTDRRATFIRLGLACALLVTGTAWLLVTHESLAVLLPLGGFVLIVGAVVLLLGPWWLRIARDLVLERQARARAEERADMAARVHDSVLQTLALIQRRAGDPAQVTQLARAQERELRSWLFEGRAPGSMAEVSSLAEGIRRIQQDVEARHGVPVEVVTVGDCPLDNDLEALLAAAREAVVNAAKWSGAAVISLFAEVTDHDVEVVVRDRGRGFDPLAVPGDRKGMAESIHGRMDRHGGTVTVQAAVGEGTKVSLKIPRNAMSSSRSGA
jgi:phage shock protein PspC (stress-responsive transcriptional regulator)/signal transduction histidine kinase